MPHPDELPNPPADDAHWPAHSGDRVRQFHHAFGHPVSPRLTEGTPELRVLRVRLIIEEALELAAALGVLVYPQVGEGGRLVGDDCLRYESTGAAPDLVEAADALGDIDYVTQGAALVFGVPLNAVGLEVHASNMSKLGVDGKPIYREDGKILKGPRYFKPDIARVLRGAC